MGVRVTFQYKNSKLIITQNRKDQLIVFLLILVFKIFVDPGLHKIRLSSLVCRCGFAYIRICGCRATVRVRPFHWYHGASMGFPLLWRVNNISQALTQQLNQAFNNILGHKHSYFTEGGQPRPSCSLLGGEYGQITRRVRRKRRTNIFPLFTPLFDFFPHKEPRLGNRKQLHPPFGSCELIVFCKD